MTLRENFYIRLLKIILELSSAGWEKIVCELKDAQYGANTVGLYWNPILIKIAPSKQ